MLSLANAYVAEGAELYIHKRYCPRKAARRIRAPLHLPLLRVAASENFKQAGLLAASTVSS